MIEGDRLTQEQLMTFNQQPSAQLLLPQPHLLEASNQLVSTDSVDFNQFKIGSDQYQCPFCAKIRKGDKTDFRRHYMTHTGEKPFECPYCPYRAVRKSDLKAHMRNRHMSIMLKYWYNYLGLSLFYRILLISRVFLLIQYRGCYLLEGYNIALSFCGRISSSIYSAHRLQFHLS